MKRSVLIRIGIGIALGVLFALAAIGISMPNNLLFNPQQLQTMNKRQNMLA